MSENQAEYTEIESDEAREARQLAKLKLRSEAVRRCVANKYAKTGVKYFTVWGHESVIKLVRDYAKALTEAILAKQAAEENDKLESRPSETQPTQPDER